MDSIPFFGDSVYKCVIDLPAEKFYLINIKDHSKCYRITFPEILEVIKYKHGEKDKDTAGLGETWIRIKTNGDWQKINGYRCLKYTAHLHPEPKIEFDIADLYMSDSLSLNLMAFKPLYDYFEKNVVFVRQVSSIFREIPQQFLFSFPQEIDLYDKSIGMNSISVIKFTFLKNENPDSVFDISGLAFKSLADFEKDQGK